MHVEFVQKVTKGQICDGSISHFMRYKNVYKMSCFIKNARLFTMWLYYYCYVSS